MKILPAIIIIILLINPALAFTLDSNTTTQYRIFKCQKTDIGATIGGGYVGDVFVNFSPSNGFPVESYLMLNLGGGSYSYSYGNNPALNWGNKSISFYLGTGGQVLTSNGNFTFVYSDACTGANIQGYQNVSYRQSGFGNYTRALFSGQRNLLEFAQQPYLDFFGYSIYLVMLFAFCSILYLKNQNIMNSLIMGVLGMATIALASTASHPYVPLVMKPYILLLSAVAMTVIFYRLFKSA